MELLKIQYQNKWYHVDKDSNGIKFYRIDGNKKNYDLSHDEMKLIQFSINSITPSGNFIKLMDYKHNGNTFEISMDLKTGLRYFNPIPNYKDLIELNMLFNNQSEYLYSTEEKKDDVIAKREKTPFVKRIIKFGKAFAIVLFAATITFEAGLIAFKIFDDIKIQDYSVAIQYTESLSDEDFLKGIQQSIYDNPNLDEKEKEIIDLYLSKNLLLSNKQYINYKSLCERLRNLKITYKSKYDNENVSGHYLVNKNEIEYFNVSNITEVQSNILSHEIFHILTEYLFYDDNILIETINSIYNEEYTYTVEDCIYKNYTDYIKALIEIIGPECFQRYKFISDKTPIIKALANICGTEYDAIRLIANLENYHKLYKSCRTTKDIKDNMENLDNLKKQIVEQIAKYYYAKYNMDYHEDLIMFYYLDDGIEFEKVIRETFKIPDDKIIYLSHPINYFNKIDYASELRFVFDKQNGINICFTINDTNRYLNKPKSI